MSHRPVYSNGGTMKDDLVRRAEQDVLNEQNLSDVIQQIVTGALLSISSLTWLLTDLEIGFPLLIIVPIIPFIVKQLRKRITYPRIGYAKIKDKSTDITIVMIVAGLLLFFAFSSYTFNLGIVPRSLLTDAWLVTFVAFIYLVLMIIGYLKRKHIIFLLYGGFAILFTSAVWIFKLSINMKLMFSCYLVLAVITLIHGIFTLRAFIRKYPVLIDES